MNTQVKKLLQIIFAVVMIVSVFLPWFTFHASYSENIGGVSLSGDSGSISYSGINIGQNYIVLITSIAALILVFVRFKFNFIFGLINVILTIVVLMYWKNNLLGTGNMSYSVAGNRVSGGAELKTAFGPYLLIISSILFSIAAIDIKVFSGAKDEPSLHQVMPATTSSNKLLIPTISVVALLLLGVGGFFIYQNHKPSLEVKIDNSKAETALPTSNHITPPASAVAATESVTSTAPTPNSQSTEEVKPSQEIIGQWGGDFGKNKIELVIQQMNDGKVSGYNTVKGITRSLSGTYSTNANSFVLTLNEPGDNPSDGIFTLNYNNNSKNMIGMWKSNNGKLTRAFTVLKD